MSDQMDVDESSEADPLEKDDRARSNFVRELVQRSNEPARVPAAHLAEPPRHIVQFWDDLGRLPRDVRECMESWKKLEQSGFELQVFDESSAREFIRIHLGSRYESAFDKCYNPASRRCQPALNHKTIALKSDSESIYKCALDALVYRHTCVLWHSRVLATDSKI